MLNNWKGIWERKADMSNFSEGMKDREKILLELKVSSGLMSLQMD